VKGVGSWASYSNNNNKPLGGRRTLPYYRCGTVKSRPGSCQHLTSKRKKKKKEKEGSLLLARAGMSSCLYMLCTMCVHLSMLEVVSTAIIQRLCNENKLVNIDNITGSK
jgi:hypothetical protein